MRSWAKRTRKRTAKNERSSSFSFSNSNETGDSSSQPARTQQAGRQAKGWGRGGSPALQSKWERIRRVRKEGAVLGFFFFFFTTQNGQWGDLQDSMAGLLLLPPDKWGPRTRTHLSWAKIFLAAWMKGKFSSGSCSTNSFPFSSWFFVSSCVGIMSSLESSSF